MYYKKDGKPIEGMKMPHQSKVSEKYEQDISEDSTEDSTKFPTWLIILLVALSIIAFLLCLKMMNKDVSKKRTTSNYPRAQKYGFRFY